MRGLGCGDGVLQEILELASPALLLPLDNGTYRAF